MLKHIKDIRSPIVVAQQKHAARKANSIISNDTVPIANPTTTTPPTTTPAGHTKSASRTITRPPKLEVQDISNTPSIMTGLSPQPGWPEASMASPAVDMNRQDELAPASAGVQQSHMSTGPAAGGASHGSDSRSTSEHPTAGRDMPVASSSTVSYAVAIYPYMAEQDDEFDVVVCVPQLNTGFLLIVLSVVIPSSSSPVLEDGGLSNETPQDQGSLKLI